MDPSTDVWTVEKTILIVCDVLLVFIFLAGTAANSLGLIIFYRRPGLRTVSNRFVVNLLATNLTSCCILLPLMLTDNLLPPGAESQIICTLGEGVTSTICAASILAVLLIALDQYCAVVDPLHYHTKINKLRSAGLILGVWCFSVMLGMLRATGTSLNEVGSSSLWRACSNATDLHSLHLEYDSAALHYRSSFASVYSALVFAIPFLAILWIYVSIYSAAHNNSKRTRKTGSGPIATLTHYHAPPPAEDYTPIPVIISPVVASVDKHSENSLPIINTSHESRTAVIESIEVVEKTPCDVEPDIRTNQPSRAPSIRSTADIVTSLRYRISNASVFRYREETRAARISALVMVMALLCWLPYVCVLMLRGWTTILGPNSHSTDAVSLVLLVTGALLSPGLFTFRNQRIQRETRRLLGCPRKRKKSGLLRNRSRSSVRLHHVNTTVALELLAGLAEVSSKENIPTAVRSHTRKSNILTSCISKNSDKTTGGTSQAQRHFIAIPESALVVDTCRSSFSSGGSTQCTSSTAETGSEDS